MHIKNISPDLFPEIYEFWQSTGLHLYPFDDEQKRFKDMLSLNPDLCVYLADDKNKIVATILGSFDGRSATINRLAVEPNEQNKGYGKLMVTKIEDIFKEKGIKKVAIMIHSANTQVIPFYEKIGFKEMDYVKMFYKDL